MKTKKMSLFFYLNIQGTRDIFEVYYFCNHISRGFFMTKFLIMYVKDLFNLNVLMNCMRRKRVNTFFNFLIFFVIVLMSSCVTHKKLLILNKIDGGGIVDSLKVRLVHDYRLQSGDILDIKVSSLDPNSVAVFNKSSGGGASSVASEASIYVNGYMIDQFGDINVPLIGNLEVKGLTLDSLNYLLDKKLAGYFKFYTVEAKLMNIRVSILGEVKAPGTQQVYNSDINLLQAISNAGGITDHGNRRKVKVIRKAFNQNEITVLDLSNEDIIYSEYFYLMPNDVIYVEPYKSKATSINIPVLAFLISSASFIILVINTVTR